MKIVLFSLQNQDKSNSHLAPNNISPIQPKQPADTSYTPHLRGEHDPVDAGRILAAISLTLAPNLLSMLLQHISYTFVIYRAAMSRIRWAIRVSRVTHERGEGYVLYSGEITMALDLMITMRATRFSASAVLGGEITGLVHSGRQCSYVLYILTQESFYNFVSFFFLLLDV